MQSKFIFDARKLNACENCTENNKNNNNNNYNNRKTKQSRKKNEIHCNSIEIVKYLEIFRAAKVSRKKKWKTFLKMAKQFGRRKYGIPWKSIVDANIIMHIDHISFNILFHRIKLAHWISLEFKHIHNVSLVVMLFFFSFLLSFLTTI